MPHVIVEHSLNVGEKYKIPALLEDIHNTLKDNGAPIERVKTRAIPLEHVIIGNALPDASMIHITVLLLEGRATEVKKSLCDPVHAVVIEKAAAHGLSNCSVTMEIRDMAADTYYK